MAKFQDVALEISDYLAVVKLWHTVDGLYIWEFITTLDYEWSVFRRRRPYRWTIWVYSLTRVATLLAVIVNMIGFDSTRPVNCQASTTSEAVFSYIAFPSASLLIVLRTIAIWNKNRIVILFTAAVWLTNLAFFIYGKSVLHISGAVKLRSVWAPAEDTCDVPNTESSKPTLFSNTITDMILLLTMLVGLSRLSFDRNMFSLGRLLWKQGIIWLLLATVAEITPTVFIVLNINEPMNLMFQAPALITMAIAATRMYRSLTDFSSSDTSQDAPQFYSATRAKQIRVDAEPIPLNQMGVAVHTQSEQYPDLYVSVDGQLYDKPQGFAIDGNVERSQENKDHRGGMV